MPGTTICPIPATWSLTAFSQVMPRLNPKDSGERRRRADRADGDDEPQSVDRGQQPIPQNCTIGTSDWASISSAFAAAIVSARK
nr:hypothetical protein [Streptomyces lienomycini]